MVEFVQKQCKDPWLALLVQFLMSDNSQKSIPLYDPKVRKWATSIAKRTKHIDGLLFYSNKFVKTLDHLCLFVPADVELQHHVLLSYNDSPLGTHQGHGATYNAIFRDFYWRNLSKHVCNWIQRCPHCIRFKALSQPHCPMQVHLYQHQFHTLGVDCVGNFLHLLLVINGFLPLSVLIPTIYELFQFQKRLQPLPHMRCFMRPSYCLVFPPVYRVIVEANFSILFCIGLQTYCLLDMYFLVTGHASVVLLSAFTAF